MRSSVRRVEERPSGQVPDDIPLTIHEPHRAGIPPLEPYFRDLWGRRHFASAYSSANIRAANVQTFFGQAWLVINPTLLALVYYMLVSVIGNGGDGTFRGGMAVLAHITSGLFLFTFVSGAMQTGAGAITGGGALILNTAFPRLLLPLAQVRTAFFRFLPTLPVFIVIRILAGEPWTLAISLCLFFLATAVLMAIGLAAAMATFQVYFRDASSFLPYFSRIWLYLSPVLWFPEKLLNATIGGFKVGLWANLNPMFSIVGGWSETALNGQVPPLWMFGFALGWSVVISVAGVLYFMSRERDFSVRI